VGTGAAVTTGGSGGETGGSKVTGELTCACFEGSNKVGCQIFEGVQESCTQREKIIQRNIK
jgi:hypothetical protein